VSEYTDLLEDARRPQVIDEVAIGGRLAAKVGVSTGWRSVGIDRDDASEPELAGYVGNPNRRSSLEAADLEIFSPRRCERGSSHYESRLSLREITRSRRDATPPLIKDLLDAVEVAD